MSKEENVRKVLSNIFTKPTTERSIRQIAREVKLTPTTTSTIIKQLHKKSIINIKTIAKTQIITANLESEEYKFKKKIHNQESLKTLVNELKKSNPFSIVLYGSYSKGEDIEESDIDIIIIGDKINIEIRKYEKKLNRKIHLIFFNTEKEIPSELMQNLKNGIILHGALL